MVPQSIGQYRIYDEIAAGGMATVHLGRLLGPAGFTRTVAIKRLHAQFAKDEEFSSMFLDEARIAARVSHPNALTALDVVAANGELHIVMDYIHGESLARLLRGGPVPLPIAISICTQALLGLHAAHEARDERGGPLRIVHRDVSPQNILVSVDGVTRVVDFGIAKAASRIHTTKEGLVKGKLAYMSPQQIQGETIDRRSDIFAAGVVLWETLVGRRLLANGDGTTMRVMLWKGIPAAELALLPDGLQPIVQRALARDPNERYPTAREMAQALAAAVTPASSMVVAEWVEQRAHATLAERTRAVARVERLDPCADTLPAFPAGGASSANSDDDTSTALASGPFRRPTVLAAWRSKHVAVLTAGAAFLVLLAVWATLRRTPELGAQAYPPREPASAGIESAATPLDQQLSAPVELASATPSTLPPTTESKLASLTPASPVGVPHQRRLKAVANAAAGANPKPKPNCAVTYVIGEGGIKRFKPECLR